VQLRILEGSKKDIDKFLEKFDGYKRGKRTA
jgi:hypothetical protein